MSNPNWGATEGDWQRIITALGLASCDLLPVVSNPNATISPRSTMKALGKTPSTYNSHRQAVGIAKWTEKNTTEDDHTRWMNDPDLGICLQTRTIRAIDIDISDPFLSRAVEAEVEAELELYDVTLPARIRSNSGKLLLAFRMPGAEFHKRVLRCGEAGIIEFLANGQQFVACGTHPSGARYEWRGGVPDEFPQLPPAIFERIWLRLEQTFSTEPTLEVVGGRRPTVKREAPTTADPVATFLETQGWCYSILRDGRLNIRCPFESEHTSESNETATQYFPAGTGGFEAGHFRCLHAHCAGRADADFRKATGYDTDAFETLPALAAEEGGVATPRFARNKDGTIISSVENVVMALASPAFTNYQLGYDKFRDEIMIAPKNTTDWRTFTDTDYTRLRINLERRSFDPVGKELARDAVALVAEETTFDSAIVWLDSLEWDGVPRVDHFVHTHLGGALSPYTIAVGRYMWSAMAGRVLQPGCVAEMVPVLVGRQGARKTSAVRSLVPHEDSFVELVLDIHDNDLARKMRGKLIGELGELRGLEGRDAEAIKQWLSRTHEEWTPKYKEFTVKFARRLLFIGTTNQDEFLMDETGNRRWLPVVVDTCDTDAILRDRLQLWAEGAALFRRGGVAFHNAEELALQVHDTHKVTDSWEGVVRSWLNGENEFQDLSGEASPSGRWKDHLHSHLVLRDALGLDPGRAKRGDEQRLGRVLRRLGFERRALRIDGQKCRVWVQL